MRYAAAVEYDGARFSGWQVQVGQRTVQACLESAVSAVADHAVSVISAGRTDTGVHATGQIIHFDSSAKRHPDQWLRGVNTNLPRDVTLRWVQEVDPAFHARFSALTRSYRYILFNRPVPSALYRTRAGFEYRELDVTAMARAALPLVGEHDFSSFRAAGCQAPSPIRNLIHIEVGECSNWIWFDMVANAFLQHMVRNLVGTLIAVGVGARSEKWPAEVLGLRDRRMAGVTAEPQGLYLTAVHYPQKFELPENQTPVKYW